MAVGVMASTALLGSSTEVRLKQMGIKGVWDCIRRHTVSSAEERLYRSPAVRQEARCVSRMVSDQPP